MIRKIARSGLKGRRKDSFLLVFVITLAFTFIVSAILLHSSSEKTKYEQKFNMFGKWQASLLNVNSNTYNNEVIDEISKDSNISKLGINKYIGKSEGFGHVMTFNDEMLDLGNFKLIEGSMPSSNDEIALELNQLSYFTNPVAVGDTVDLSVEINLLELDESEANDLLNKNYISLLGAEEEDYYKNFYENNKEDVDATLESASEYLSSLFLDIKDEDLRHEAMINEVISWFMYVPSTNKRNEQELEEFDGTRVLTRSSYLYFTDIEIDETSNDADNIEAVKRNGVLYSQKVIISRPMKISGIIETYSNLWDTKEFPVANSLISEEAGKSFLENGFYKTQYNDLVIDIEDYSPPLNLFIDSNMDVSSFIEEYKAKYSELERNSYAYPDLAGSTEDTLTYSIVAFVFVATVFAVFQIYLTQMRRRTRKLALLKSIGASNNQVVRLIIWEGVYLLIISLIIGILTGFALAKGLILLMNQNEINNLIFDVNYNLLALGVSIGILAVIIGMLLPVILAINIPLTGRISKPPKHKNSTLKLKTKREKKDLYKVNKQSFLNISIRHVMFNKSKYLITVLLYTVTITVLISSVFLSYLFFQDYINQVIIVDKPNYGYEVAYGIPNREIKEVVKEIESIEGVVSVDTHKSGENAYMWYETISLQELYPVFKNILPTHLLREHFGDLDEFANIDSSNKHLIAESLVTNVYGLEADSSFDKISNYLTEGNLNKEKFISGDEVLVLMPMYQINNEPSIDKITDQNIINNSSFKNRVKTFANVSRAYDISYDFRYKDMYSKDSSLNPGDSLYLSVPNENFEGDTMGNEVVTHKVKVGGIIHYFPEIGMWPFADSLENPVVIGSNSFLGKLYPSTIFGPGRYFYETNIESLTNLIESLYPTKFGKTFFYINTDNEADELNTFVDLQRIALDRKFTFINYQENIKAVFAKAFNFTSIIAVIGVVIAGISLIILYNTTLSKIEQERDRIGILQSLGVTSNQFNFLYLLTGFLSTITALIIGHGILLLIIYLTMDYSLWLYPLKIHIGVSIGFVVLATLVYYIPLRKIIKNQPVYNIRSLNR